MTEASKDWCYFVSGEEYDENGCIPSMVMRDQPGYSPLAGDGTQRPWYWGKSYAEARATAERVNQEMGISPAQASEIVLSSIRASNLLVKQVRDSGKK